MLPERVAVKLSNFWRIWCLIHTCRHWTWIFFGEERIGRWKSLSARGLGFRPPQLRGFSIFYCYYYYFFFFTIFNTHTKFGLWILSPRSYFCRKNSKWKTNPIGVFPRLFYIYHENCNPHTKVKHPKAVDAKEYCKYPAFFLNCKILPRQSGNTANNGNTPINNGKSIHCYTCSTNFKMVGCLQGL